MSSVALSKQHIRGLDGVRGVAILLVLMVHFGLMIPGSALERAVFGVVSAGWIGVDLFFVLSGALITGILLDSKGENLHQTPLHDYFARFYVRRMLRIFPLYYAILILSFYVLPYLPFPKVAYFSRIDGIAGKEPCYWLFVANFSMAAQGGARHSIMDITWSLSIEEQFYVVWPFIVYFFRIRTLAITCASLILFSLGLRLVMQALDYQPYTVYVVTPARLDGLCAGGLVAIALRWPGMTPGKLRSLATALCWAGGVATACVAYFSGGLPWDGKIVQSIGFTTLACFFAGVVLLTVVSNGSGSLLERVVRSRLLVSFGVLAYGIYLMHLPVRTFLTDTLMRPSSFPAWPGGTLVGQMVFYVVSGAAIYLIAGLSYYAFEKWFLRLKPGKAGR